MYIDSFHSFQGSTTPTTTTTTTTEAPPQPLSGDDCAAFLKNVNTGFSDEQGTIEFLVPQQANEWELNVSVLFHHF